MIYKINIIGNNNNDYILFHSKRDIVENKFIQKKLKFININKKNNTSNQMQMFCGCKQSDSLELFTRSLNGRYHIAVAPNTSNFHRKDCIFYNHKEKLEDDNGFFRSLIFEEPKKTVNKDGIKEEIIEKENHRVLTFNNFCYTLIEKSQTSCFNILNSHTVKKSNFDFSDLRQPALRDFFRAINLNCGKQKKEEYYLLEKNTSIYDAVKKVGRINFGITYDNIFSENYFMGRQYTTFKMKSYFVRDGEMKDIKFSITTDVIKKAKRSNTIYSNYIKPPYFIIAITAKNKNGFFTAKRFFAIPIEFIDINRPFAFVDSNYERSFLKKILLDKMIFIKPIKNEFNNLYQEIRKKISTIGKALYLTNRPDIITLKNKNSIEIIEIAGMSDTSYKNQLNTKILKYKEEIGRVKGEKNCTVKIL